MKRTHTKLNTAEGQTKRFGVGMLSPTVVILLIMTAYPLIFTFFYSFTNYNLLRNLRSPAKITFFQNYVKLLKDPYFQQSIWNTVKFTIFAVIFEMLIWLAIGTVRQQPAQGSENHAYPAAAALSAADPLR